ncbi:MAG: FAD-dependent oxidoreductase [Gammaproteobacteria bacterium]|nr:FAD-dependent oxidoreductase [Gammaproteobacteria bacterium]
MITRREFNAGLIASVAALPFASVAGEQKAKGDGPPLDVLVIGAGLSGLHSALMLEELGARVQVIEARKRIGGRLYTLFDRPGHPEVGGNSCAAGYGRVLNRIQQMGLPLYDASTRPPKKQGIELALGSRILQRDEWAKSPLNPFPQESRSQMPWEFSGAFMAANNPLKTSEDWLAESSAPLDVSLRDWLVSRGVNEATVERCWSTNPYFGTTAHDVSALLCLMNASWSKAITGGSRSMLSVQGGNQKLPLAMAGKLKNEVHLGKDVAAIRDNGSIVEVTCRDGSSYRAKSVVCSIPFSVLRHIAFEPGLTGPQAEAVNTLPYMMNTLVFFVPKRKYWEDDGLHPSMWTDGVAGSIMAQRFGSDAEEVTAIVANPRGKNAIWLDRLPPKDAIRYVQAEIERLRPAAKGALVDGAIHSWDRDPFAAGDWAVLAPGQVRRFKTSMANAHGRVHFCGEHTALTNRGMEGAMESAERVTLEIGEIL